MPRLNQNKNEAAVASKDLQDRRSGKDRRLLADRRKEPRFGDVEERRSEGDRRRPIGNFSLD